MAQCPLRLRRIEVWRPAQEDDLVCLRNQVRWGATTMAALDKARWQIDRCFKALQQNLTIKTFVGPRANAVKIPVWTALIAMLLRRGLPLKARFTWSRSNLVALLRMNLFTYRDLWRGLHQPFETPPGPRALPPPAQLAW